MKKLFLILFMLITAMAVYSQEIVGNITISKPDYNLEFNFYDSNIKLDTIFLILLEYFLSSQTSGMTAVDDDLNDELFEAILNLDVDDDDFIFTWGVDSPYYTEIYTFKYNEKKYFALFIMPESNYWIFETDTDVILEDVIWE